MSSGARKCRRAHIEKGLRSHLSGSDGQAERRPAAFNASLSLPLVNQRALKLAAAPHGPLTTISAHDSPLYPTTPIDA
jgi:hypothetical protein